MAPDTKKSRAARAAEPGDPFTRLKAAIEALDAAMRDASPAHEAGATPPDDAASGPAGKAERLADWLRADMSARFLGAASIPFADTEALPAAPRDEPLPYPGAAGAAISIAPPAPQTGPPERKATYTIAELLGYDDETFVRNAYLTLLRREPEAHRLESVARSLRTGDVTRRELLADIRFSPEGRAAGVRVAGLERTWMLRRLQRIPVLGRLASIVIYVFRLPSIGRHLELIEAEAMRRALDLDSRLRTLGTAAEGALRDLAQAIEARQRADRSYAGALARTIEGVIASDRAIRKWAGEFGESLTSVRMSAAKLEQRVRTQATREDLARLAHPLLESLEALRRAAVEFESQKGTIALVEAGAKQALLELGAVQTAQQELAARIGHTIPASAQQRELDAFYLEFEHRFRGERDDIKGRVRVYLPQVEEAYRATGEAPVLDIGCGRGEWLEVLKEAGIKARGVDSNGAMVTATRETGLDIVGSDALLFLKTLESDSLGAVTAFHVIEHLPFADLVALFDEAMRTLRPGGMILFETPNPESLVVGACNFWYDPTHVRPIPPPVMEYVAQARGFARPEIKRMHPFAEWELLPPGIDEQVRARLNDVIYGAQDYAIVAYKPGGAAAEA